MPYYFDSSIVFDNINYWAMGSNIERERERERESSE
jgi:hypothetical protein